MITIISFSANINWLYRLIVVLRRRWSLLKDRKFFYCDSFSNNLWVIDRDIQYKTIRRELRRLFLILHPSKEKFWQKRIKIEHIKIEQILFLFENWKIGPNFWENLRKTKKLTANFERSIYEIVIMEFLYFRKNFSGAFFGRKVRKQLNTGLLS